MTKFRVCVEEIRSAHLVIDAGDIWEARKLAEHCVSNGCYPDGSDLPEFHSDYLIDRIVWNIPGISKGEAK